MREKSAGSKSTESLKEIARFIILPLTFVLTFLLAISTPQKKSDVEISKIVISTAHGVVNTLTLKGELRGIVTGKEFFRGGDFGVLVLKVLIIDGEKTREEVAFAVASENLVEGDKVIIHSLSARTLHTAESPYFIATKIKVEK